VRSALLEIKGVTRVQVSLEKGEAIITYDPRAAGTQALIEAVGKAVGPGPFTYSATVKVPPSPAGSAQ
jgi:copper chaperone CopZ